MSVRVAPLCCLSAKKDPFFFFSSRFTGTINVPWPSLALFCSHFPSFSPSLTEVSPLYWVVQKQNHKPISVTLAMRLDGPNLSPSGAIGSTPVSLKRPLSSRRRGSFLFGDNCYWALAVHVTCSNPSRTLLSGDMITFLRYRWGMWRCLYPTIKTYVECLQMKLPNDEWEISTQESLVDCAKETILKPLYGATEEAVSATVDLLALYPHSQRKRKRHADFCSSSWSHAYVSFPSITMEIHIPLHGGLKLTVPFKLSLNDCSATHHPIKSTPAISISSHLPLNICFHFPPG